MKCKTGDLNLSMKIIIIVIINLGFTILSDIPRCKIINKFLISPSLNDVLNILPSISHSHLRMFDTNFTFQNFRAYTKNEKCRHTIVITQVCKY